MSHPHEPSGDEERPNSEDPYRSDEQNPYGSPPPEGGYGGYPSGPPPGGQYGGYPSAPPPEGQYGGYPSAPPPGGQYGGYPPGPPPGGQYGYSPYGPPQRESSAPLVLSIIGIVCWFLCAPAAIVLGLIAQAQANRNGQPTALPRVAWIGGIVALVLGFIVAIPRIHG